MDLDQPFLNMMLYTDEPWFIADNSSEPQYVFTNPVYKAICNVPARFDFEGRTFREIPHPAFEEYWHVFNHHDQLVIKTEQSLSSLDTHVMGKSQRVQSYIFKKEPFYNAQGHCVGTITHGKKVQLLSHIRVLKGHVLFHPPSELFTDKEWQVIYLLFCDLSSVKMAKLLHLSLREVEQCVVSCLSKAKVTSQQQLLQYCCHLGWDSYVPPYFIQKGYISLSS